MFVTGVIPKLRIIPASPFRTDDWPGVTANEK